MPLDPVPKLVPPEHPNRGGTQKEDSVNSQYVILFLSTYDKGALNRPNLRFNIFFVLTRAMWGLHNTVFILLVMGGPCKFFEKYQLQN